MNIEEVLYLPVKREGLIIGPDEFDCKHRYRTLDGEEVASSFKAKSVDELADQQKQEVPQFVADWIEECKEEDLTLKGLFSNSDMPAKIFDWTFSSDENCRLMAEAWINGYTVEKEKLYTVEIPNPNTAGGKTVLFKKQSTNLVVMGYLGEGINKPSYLHLTEAEIRKDFDWAWQWAEEVTE
ncbi:DUF1642 domain-containing protein [Streptococcus dysgalactiae subsp. equisimilis]|uniref:DUF1642 domain-containing protein n=1 Tax=Streptococcus dysgalactiae TaxID=1334 RepID=UPI001F134853|nr:DUF1642 domain-containing protein [Streptococcus dysgalactiae]UMY67881.1 DUF1642 domain-containing protein [Streptococcus dysgalactiae subsp. equisimilis]